MASQQVDIDAVPGEAPSGGGHWVDDEKPAYSGVPCKRHRWKGGGTCVRCGAPKPLRAAARPRTDISGVRSRAGSFETMAAMLWGSIGMGVEYQAPILARLQHKKDVVEPGEVSGAVGRAMQLEMSIAGKRIDKAFHKASPFWYGVVSHFLGRATWFTELVPLMVPPVVVGVMAQWPDLAERFKPQLIGAMMPVLVEIAKDQQRQAELMETMGEYNASAYKQAEAVIDNIIDANHSTSDSGNPTS